MKAPLPRIAVQQSTMLLFPLLPFSLLLGGPSLLQCVRWSHVGGGAGSVGKPCS